MKAVAAKLGSGTIETLRKWVRRDEIDAGTRPGPTTEESAQVKAMKKEIATGCRSASLAANANGTFRTEQEGPQEEIFLRSSH
jgi:transposase